MQWAGSQETDVNNNNYNKECFEDEQFSDERDNLVRHSSVFYYRFLPCLQLQGCTLSPL